eukprot:TRINITY_DN4719_c0_g1_i2.p1 TRINITY_DN4719_c0_g1~~TRINITY_DN4719_c0_g1_i2.p1  ORF type:complete len:752 (-),score=73.66 TRINITY_DN4719_c0_g1_i2:24-2279(-)
MKAGTTCTVKVINSLSTTSGVSNCAYHENNLHCPDTTNLHTHGLHVTPKDKGDNINVTIIPGTTHEYQYPLQDDLLMGTHWYHAHYHGSTTLQTLGGLFGFLITEPSSSYALPADLKTLYSKARLLALNNFDFRPDTGLLYLKSWRTISESYPIQSVNANISLGFGDDNEFYAVNGQYQPYIEVTQGEVFLLRILHASGGRIIELLPLDPVDHGCTMTLIARDGVFHKTPYQQVTVLTMLQGTRSDVAFKCTKPGVITLGNSPQVENEVWFGSFLTNERSFQANVFQIKVKPPNGAVSPTTFPTSEAPMPHYLTSLLDDTSTKVSWSIHLSGASTATAGQGLNVSTDLGVNELPWQGWEEEHVHFHKTLCPNQTYSISLHGAHPYHQHINHFQIKSTSGPANAVRVGEWRDLMLGTSPPSTQSTEVLTKTWDYSGYYIFHCHIVEHEDAGLMGAYHVLDTCQNDIGIWILSALSDGTISISPSSLVTSNLKASAVLKGCFEFLGKNYTRVPSSASILSSVAGLSWDQESRTKEVPYPELCKTSTNTCFDVTATGEIRSTTTSEMEGDATIQLAGGYNPSTTQAVSVSVAGGRNVSVPPLGIKFDTNVVWTANQSAPVTSLCSQFYVTWTYTPVGTAKYTYSLDYVPSTVAGKITGITIKYATSSLTLAFPGAVTVTTNRGTRLLDGNIVEDVSQRVMGDRGGSTTLYVMFEFVTDAKIRIDPILFMEENASALLAPTIWVAILTALLRLQL